MNQKEYGYKENLFEKLRKYVKKKTPLFSVSAYPLFTRIRQVKLKKKK